MRAIALVALLFTLSEVTLAQTPECKSIPKANDRLACYDKGNAPDRGEQTPNVQNSHSV
jgi:hypothetical protein